MRYSYLDIRDEPDVKFYLDSGYPARPSTELDAQPKASYLVDRILNLIIYAGYRIFLKTRYPDLMIIILLHPWRGIAESILRSYRSGSGPREKPGPDPILIKNCILTMLLLDDVSESRCLQPDPGSKSDPTLNQQDLQLW